ncbi:hypothetical protein RJ639_029425, partial [Escallonia herrerae]
KEKKNLINFDQLSAYGATFSFNPSVQLRLLTCYAFHMVDDAGAVGAGGSGNSCPLPPRPPKRKKETSTREPSQVWDHFQKIKRNTPSEPDPEIIICKYCSKRYGYTGANGTMNDGGVVKDVVDKVKENLVRLFEQ